ncbi:MAG: group III truncated hemoglobin [Bacteroidota bacterium]|jgi:hemoglobin
MKKVLENREDIELLVNNFYSKIRQNETLGNIFDKIAQVNWENHLPKMYNFWEMILFGNEGYEGFPLRPHLAINSIHPLNPQHFHEWLSLFDATVDENFEGEKAEEVKSRAKNIALSWAYKIHYMNQENAISA